MEHAAGHPVSLRGPRDYVLPSVRLSKSA
jgi:hypothetical protein